MDVVFCLYFFLFLFPSQDSLIRLFTVYERNSVQQETRVSGQLIMIAR